jgi:hypothetical protein
LCYGNHDLKKKQKIEVKTIQTDRQTLVAKVSRLDNREKWVVFFFGGRFFDYSGMEVTGKKF